MLLMAVASVQDGSKLQKLIWTGKMAMERLFHLLCMGLFFSIYGVVNDWIIM